jgi:hypothetical protein
MSTRTPAAKSKSAVCSMLSVYPSKQSTHPSFIQRMNLRAFDGLVEESQINFIIDMQDDGYTAEDAEEVLESQRARMAAWRKKALADVRCFLERDGENLNR